MAKIKCEVDGCSYTHVRAAVVGAHRFRVHNVAGVSPSVTRKNPKPFADVAKQSKTALAVIPPVINVSKSNGRLNYQAMIDSLKQEWHLLNGTINQLILLQQLHGK